MCINSCSIWFYNWGDGEGKCYSTEFCRERVKLVAVFFKIMMDHLIKRFNSITKIRSTYAIWLSVQLQHSMLKKWTNLKEYHITLDGPFTLSRCVETFLHNKWKKNRPKRQLRIIFTGCSMWQVTRICCCYSTGSYVNVFKNQFSWHYELVNSKQ